MNRNTRPAGDGGSGLTCSRSVHPSRAFAKTSGSQQTATRALAWLKLGCDVCVRYRVCKYWLVELCVQTGASMLLVRAMVLLNPLVSGGGVFCVVFSTNTPSPPAVMKTSSIDLNLKTFQNVSQSIYINLIFDSNLYICQLCYFFFSNFSQSPLN